MLSKQTVSIAVDHGGTCFIRIGARDRRHAALVTVQFTCRAPAESREVIAII
jgi:hypothetical protein